MAYGITAVTDQPPATANAFPDFLQFQANGTDLGGADADTLNFIGGLVTRGTGESAATVTVDFSGFVWREVGNDDHLVKADAGNGIVTTGTTGAQTITVRSDTGDTSQDFLTGAMVLVYQEGAAPVHIVSESGVTLQVRGDFLTDTATQYSIITLIKRGANTWSVSGDMLQFVGAIGGDSVDYGSL